jgi:uncharacterized phage protein gp47/JayE
MKYLKITAPTGTSYSSDTTYSVGSDEHTLYGLISEYTTLKITFEGYTFTSDQEITIFDDGTWMLPNIDLKHGNNTFTLEAYDVEQNKAKIILNVTLPNDVLAIPPEPPTNISVKRAADSVVISWVHVDSNVTQYNVYASQVSGGGPNGYLRINATPLSPLKYGQTNERATLIGDLSSDFDPVEIDPLVVEVVANQSSASTDVIGSVEVPEGANRLRVTSSVYTTELETTLSFSHNRSASLTSEPPTFQIGEFSILSKDTPLYYVVTAISTIDGVSLESEFSVEASGYPIDITASNLGLPSVSDEKLTQEIIASIYQADPSASVQAGSVIRDLFIDPMVSEISRTRFVLDFGYRATNFVSLLGIDDPLNSGRSINVGNSSYKQTLKDALFLDTDNQVQALIDSCFDRLASNLGVVRRKGSRARGEVVFYTTSAPTFDLVIPSGTTLTSGSVSFRTTREGYLASESANLNYNPFTKRYEVTIPIEAITQGSIGNLPSGKITQGSPSGLSVTNTAPTFGGLDEENNNDLAARALSYISSVDNGTRAGYGRLASEAARVESYYISGSGDEYMVRDQGLGGKVDIWVRGEVLSEVTDVFAPSYQAVKGDRFIPLYSEGAYAFQASSVSQDNPLYEMVDRANQYGLLNHTTGEFFDLTNSTITEGKIITLDKSLDQPVYRFGDVILGDYRTASTKKIVLTRQPVKEVLEVTTQEGVSIQSYSFEKSEDPLMLGLSTKAEDHVVIENFEGDKLIDYTENLVFNQTYPEAVSFKGVDVSSIALQNEQGAFFSNPFTSANPDYTIKTETDGTTYIARTSTSSIPEGVEIITTYQHLQNIVVRYTTNLVVSSFQETIDKEKHMGADVLVKEVSPSPVDIKAVVYLERGTNPVTVDSVIRANLATRVQAEGQGGAIYPSDVIREIDAVTGVSHVQVPLRQMALSEGTRVLREPVSPTLPSMITQVVTSSHSLWLIDSTLKHKTQPSGGAFGRVFIDGLEVPILNENQRGMVGSYNETLAVIVGDEGFYLYLEGQYTLIEGCEQRVLLCLPQGQTPNDKLIEVNYLTANASNYVSEIKLNPLSYMTSGDFSFIYEEVK